MNHYTAPSKKPLNLQCPARSSREFMKHQGVQPVGLSSRVRWKRFWRSFSTLSRIDFEGSRSTFESALCQKAVRRAARRNGVCAATLANGRAIGCAPRLASIALSHTPHLTRKVRQAASSPLSKDRSCQTTRGVLRGRGTHNRARRNPDRQYRW